jgi:hypothetical protein
MSATNPFAAAATDLTKPITDSLKFEFDKTTVRNRAAGAKRFLRARQ